MTNINVQFKGIKQFHKALQNTESQIERKAQQALNRTLTRSRTQMTNAIGERLNLKKKTIRELMSIQKANKNTGLVGRLTVKNKPVSLIAYNAKQNRKGVSFKLYRNRLRQLIRSAFISVNRNGMESVFKRESRARLKIKPLYGTMVRDVAQDKLMKIVVTATAHFSNELFRLIYIK